jgi:thiol:disulfide interchange protein DsbD
MKTTLWLLAWMTTSAAMAASPRHVEFNMRVEPATVRAGETAQLIVKAVVDGGWHIYSLTQPPGGPSKTRIEITPHPAIENVGGFTGPAPQRKHDAAFNMEVEYHEGTAEFRAPVQLKAGAATGRLKVEGKVSYMVCDAQSCLPPGSAAISADLVIEPGEARAQFKKTASAPASAPAADQADGLGALILLAIISGFVSLLTPCVFPMIPITVSFFTKEAAADRTRALKLAVVYALSIVATFTLVGVVLTLLLGAGSANKVAASPLVNVGIGVLFVAFALSLFGLFEIRLPSSWIDAAQSRAGAGTAGAVFMGLVFTLTSFTCTAPFIGPLLVAITQGAWFWPLVGMSVFSATFASPFFLLSLFPGWLAGLPKSGGWLNSTKVVMGFLELAAAMKFLSNADLIQGWDVFNTPVVLASWIVLAALTGFYILGMIRLPHDSPVESVGGVRLMFSLVFFVLALVMAPGLLQIPPPKLIDSYLPVPVALKQEPAAAVKGAEIPAWGDDYAKALARAKAESRNVFIDFTGYTCTNCRWMEISMFPLPEIEAALKQFVLVRLYTDGGPRGEENQNFQVARFGDAALPLYVIMGRDDQEIARFSGLTRDRKAFLEFLRRGL